ncbi:hypothetical protein EDB81DRAFT_716016 [Dactylonectria macrodidyma]|uniref:Nephrocystin 3-like N-terminal domain-containing protein n=1 Tax=Dactylonectria macrodidyma TaxID=307937 RepID=A0A9P9F8U1_9HYPO|nr:hypothetical protein EDB81DRAFT_716016 [Dactylonectria macrodidyma]
MSAQTKLPQVIPATGLTVVVPHDDPALDIVFVHGFTGHPERTWRHKRGDPRQSENDIDDTSEPQPKARRFNPFPTFRPDNNAVYSSSVYWPRDLLPTTVPNARVLTYGYDTNIRHWANQPVSRNTVRDIGWDFLVALEAGRRDAPTRPLLFIVHSLGGIVVKEMLRRSSGCSQGQHHLRHVFDSTNGIMFFGTPHGGADPRKFLQHAAELVIRAIGYKVNEDIVNTLLPSSERLKELRDEFSPMAHEKQWTIHSFQEQLGIKSLNGRKVVEDTSSYLNFSSIETTEHICHSHIDMCRFTGPEDPEYKKVSAALERMVSNLRQSETTTATYSLTSEQKQQLRDSLKFAQIDARYMTIKSAHARTCKWLKKMDEYRHWLDPNQLHKHHGFLWIKGKPGTGKSTLMKFAMAQARRTMKDKIILSFFFNARGEKLEKSTVGMYRSLLLQLLDGIPTLEAIFDSLHLTSWPQDGLMEWSVELLKDLFEQGVQLLGKSEVVCFIDALDECNENQVRDMVSFFQHIGELATAFNIRFQVCFSSRHYPYITIDHGLELVLEGQVGHDQDIANYVNCELKIGHSKAADEIRAELQAKASGIFMWIVLVVDILNKEHDRGRIHALRKRLREIPAGLHELFRDILTRDTRDREELILCIQWVSFASRPLCPEELYFAVLAGTDPEFLAPRDLELTTLSIIERFILDCSKGLVETTKSKLPVVQFIHESVRDFLLKDGGLHDIWPDLGNGFQGQSHETLKKCCLKYINADISGSLRLPEQLPKASSSDAAELRERTQQAFPFLKYAVTKIFYHANEAESEGISQHHFLKSLPLPQWIYLDNLLEKFESRRHTSEASILYLLAEGNMAHLLERHFSMSSPLEKTGERYETPLFAALATGSVHATQVLAEIGLLKYKNSRFSFRELCRQYSENPNSIPNLGRDFCPSKSLLAHYTQFGEARLGLLALALGKDDVNCRNNRQQTPLHTACENGHLAVARLLIESGADKEAKDTRDMTPLHVAATRGHPDIGRLLVEAGADIGACGNYGWTPLHYAADSGHLDIGSVLIEAGADKEGRDAMGLTSLHVAARRGHSDIGRLLIKAGANIDARIPEVWWTPLFYAAKHGHLDFGRLLIEAGADQQA